MCIRDSVNPDELTLSRLYDIDFSNLVPAGQAQFHNLRVRVVNASSTGCDLLGGLFDEKVATFSKTAPSQPATLTLVHETAVDGGSATAGRFVSFDFPSTFDRTKLDSLNGILNNEHGTSDEITTASPQTFTLGTVPSHQDECAYLHMTPAPNSTLSCMGNAGARNIVSRIPLSAKYPAQNHHQLFSHEYDLSLIHI